MTDADRLVWREAYDLYDTNHASDHTDAAWCWFYQKISEFAERNGWKSRPLVKHLAFALIDAVGEEARLRLEEEARQPAQLSFLPPAEPAPEALRTVQWQPRSDPPQGREASAGPL